MTKNSDILSYAGISTSVGDGIVALRSAASHLGGSSSREKLEIDMWLTFASKSMSQELLNALNCTLVYKTFLVGCSITLADFAVFGAVSDNASLGAFKNLTRWAKHINTFVPLELRKSFVNSAQVTIPVAQVDSAVEVTPAATKGSLNGKADVPVSVPPPAAASSTAESAKADKVDDNGSGLDPTKLDIRVGHVLKCWNHPDSEKLLCEEVDLGGGEVRLIASGLRAFYSAEQLQGRRVVVLANLKERSMAGFKSQGMVLCAVSKDHSVVRLLEVPDGAKPGDRISFPGFPADSQPATAAQMVKKKILEGLAPGLRTDAAGVAHWDKSPFTLGSGVVSAPGVADAVVS